MTPCLRRVSGEQPSRALLDRLSQLAVPRPIERRPVDCSAGARAWILVRAGNCAVMVATTAPEQPVPHTPPAVALGAAVLGLVLAGLLYRFPPSLALALVGGIVLVEALGLR